MNQIAYDQRKRVYHHALAQWGHKAQMMMVIEEMSDLTKALCKYFRGEQDLYAIAEETADVTIMLEQLRELLGMNDLVCEQMDRKIMRMADRIGLDVNNIIQNCL